MTAIDAEARRRIRQLANTLVALSSYPDLLWDIAEDQERQHPKTAGIDWRVAFAGIRMGAYAHIGDRVSFYPDGDGIKTGRVAAIGSRATEPGHTLLIVGDNGRLYYREDIYCWKAFDSQQITDPTDTTSLPVPATPDTPTEQDGAE